MSDEATAGFLIDGKRYELPDMGTFTVKESRVFYKETGLVPEVVRMRLADETLTYLELLDNIGFIPALATIAYTRDNPDATDVQVDTVIGNTPRDDLFMALLDIPEVEPDPPLSGATSAPPESSPNDSSRSKPSSEDESSISGPASTKSSGKPGDTLGATGTIESDTSPTSVLVR